MESQEESIKSDSFYEDTILNLIDMMRLKGFNIGMHQYLCVQELLINLAAKEKMPDHPSKLKAYIGPVICSSSKEQELFDAQWDTFFSIQLPKPSPHTDVHTSLKTIEKHEKKWHLIWPWKNFSQICGVVLALILGMITIQYMWYDFSVYLWTIVGFALGLIGFRLLLLQISMSQYVSRQSTSASRLIRSLFVEKPSDSPFHSLSMYRLSQIFRKHQVIKSQDLNIDATIEKTIQNCGLVSPVYGNNHRSPEYLALIDQQSLMDHQTYFADALLDTFENQEVYITRYYYDHSPQYCYSDQEKSKLISINELMVIYPDHRLVIFSNGECLINPLTDDPVDWIDQLNYWEYNVLMTFADEISRYGGIHPLLDSDFLVVPATVKGLSQYIDYVHSMEPPQPYPITLPEVPSCLRDEIDVLLHIYPPEQDFQRMIYGAMMNYLGQSGYEWLTACSIYPILEWNLTIYLGIHLTDKHGKSFFDMQKLSALSQLPWFRVGKMPNWLREHLINDMTLSQEQQVRQLIHQLFITAIHEPVNSFELTFKTHDQSMTKRLGRYVLGKLKQSNIPSPMQDDIFITFMTDPLAVKIPKIVKKNFSKYKKNQTIDEVSQLKKEVSKNYGEDIKKDYNRWLEGKKSEEEEERTRIPQSAYLLCDRSQQAHAFINFFKNSNGHTSKLPLFYIVHGSINQCHKSLINRLRLSVLKEYLNSSNFYSDPIQVIDALWPSFHIKKFRNKKITLIQDLFNAIVGSKSYEMTLDLYSLLQHDQFSIDGIYMIFHQIEASLWDINLIRWYIYDFWQINNYNFKGVPRFIIFFNVIYPNNKGFRGIRNRSMIKRVKKELYKLKENSLICILPELLPVDIIEVSEWFDLYMPNMEREERHRILNSIFVNSKIVDMDKVERILFDLVKKNFEIDIRS